MAGLEVLSPRTILGMFDKALEEFGLAGWIGSLSFLNDGVDDFEEKYGWLDQVPPMRKWEGERRAIGMGPNIVTVPMDQYEATIGFHRRELRHDNTGTIERRIRRLVQKGSGPHWAKLVTGLILNGSTSVATFGAAATYDKANFFGNGHRGAQDNTLSVTGLTGGRPTVAQAEEAWLKAIETILGFTDVHDEPENEGAESFICICHPTILGPMAAAAGLQQIQGASGTRQNVAINLGFALDVQSNTRLSASGWDTGATRKCAIARTAAVVAPFIRQETREGVQSGALTEGSEHAFKHNEHLYGIEAERGAGFGLWEHIIEVTFAA